jgi:hypothetical protein
MDDNKNIKALGLKTKTCPEHQTCLFRIEVLEKWKEGVEKKLDGLSKLLIANLSGVVLTLLGIIGGLLIYIVK